MKIKILTAVIGFFTLISIGTSAQTSSGKQDFPNGFTGVEIGDYFKATIKHADYYGVEWTVDKELEKFIHIYLRGDVLVATVDRKAMDLATKKKYFGKKIEDAVLKVEISTPKLGSVSIMDNAILDAGEFGVESSRFTLDATGNSQVKNLTVNASAVTLSASKKAVLSNVSVKADNFSINSFNSAVINVEQTSKTMSLQLNDTSELTVKGDSESINVTGMNSARLNLEGNAVSLDLNAGCREIHAENFTVNDTVVKASNACKVYVNSTESLSIDLKAGCYLYYGGTPVIDIANIQNSSVSHLTF